MNNNINNIEKFLVKVKLKINSFNEFKTLYNKQLALDFNVLDFFKIGENKVTEILAFFLDVKNSHGQGSAFLTLFIEHFIDLEVDLSDLSNVEIICEKTTDTNRRIDLLIKFKNYYIGIENKIWANDQKNQIKDYSIYLDKISNKRYTLFYLSPYGKDPSEISISNIEYEKNKNLKTISYSKHILPLIEKWISISEAANVSYFLEQFKKHLEVKFLGNKTINMTKTLKHLILDNVDETNEIVNTYNKIHSQISEKIVTIGECIIAEYEPKVKFKKEFYTDKGFKKFRYRIFEKNEFVKIIINRSNFDLFLTIQTLEQYSNLKSLIEVSNDKISLKGKTDNEIKNLFIRRVKLIIEQIQKSKVNSKI